MDIFKTYFFSSLSLLRGKFLAGRKIEFIALIYSSYRQNLAAVIFGPIIWDGFQSSPARSLNFFRMHFCRPFIDPPQPRTLVSPSSSLPPSCRFLSHTQSFAHEGIASFFIPKNIKHFHSPPKKTSFTFALIVARILFFGGGKGVLVPILIN